MDDWFQDKPEYTGPTTDEMDHTTPEDRYKLVIMCAQCSGWHHFVGGRDRKSQTDGEQCSNCGSKTFIGSTIISERTWNPNRKIPKSKR